MSIIIRCDGGCGSESPDDGQFHVANQWFRVRAGSNVHFERRTEHDDLLFCDACATAVKAALKATHSHA